MSWWRRWWRWLLGGTVVILGAGVLLVLWALRKRREAAALKAELAVLKPLLHVDALEADKKARADELQRNAEEAKQADARIAQAKREVLAVTREVKDLSDDAVVNLFNQLY